MSDWLVTLHLSFLTITYKIIICSKMSNRNTIREMVPLILLHNVPDDVVGAK